MQVKRFRQVMGVKGQAGSQFLSMLRQNFILVLGGAALHFV
jgi:hypothetical protein